MTAFCSLCTWQYDDSMYPGGWTGDWTEEQKLAHCDDQGYDGLTLATDRCASTGRMARLD